MTAILEGELLFMKRLNKSRFNRGNRVELRTDIPPFVKYQQATVTDPYKDASYCIEITDDMGVSRRVPCGRNYLRLV